MWHIDCFIEVSVVVVVFSFHNVMKRRVVGFIRSKKDLLRISVAAQIINHFSLIIDHVV